MTIHYIYSINAPTIVVAWGYTLANGGLGYTDQSAYLETSGPSLPPNSTIASTLPQISGSSGALGGLLK